MKFVDSKSALQNPVVYATGRSKAVVLVLLILWDFLDFTTGRF